MTAEELEEDRIFNEMILGQLGIQMKMWNCILCLTLSQKSIPVGLKK